MYKHLYRRFLEANPTLLHFASHSHHYWPDATREAQLQYWDDSAKHVDHKWEFLFTQKVTVAQKLIAENLNLSNPSQIVFAPNTHEFVFRLISSLDWTKKISILTTDSEFYSFDRQANRLAEFAQFEVVKVPVMPFDTFHERFEQELASRSWNLVFLSHVFFNSALVSDFKRLSQKASPSSLFVVDGYHGFMAVPTDLKTVEDKIFYLAGSYKYAQGGEGACFLHVPSSARHRPFYTGWFAELAHLSAVGNQVPYPEDASQYSGSTMDLTPVYRLIATLETFKKEGLSVTKIHSWVQQNQKLFLEELEKKHHPLLNKRSLIVSDLNHHGHFLTFNLPSVEETQKMVAHLKNQGVLTDSRGTRLRFGFGLYHDKSQIEKCISLI